MTINPDHAEVTATQGPRLWRIRTIYLMSFWRARGITFPLTLDHPPRPLGIVRMSIPPAPGKPPFEVGFAVLNFEVPTYNGAPWVLEGMVCQVDPATRVLLGRCYRIIYDPLSRSGPASHWHLFGPARPTISDLWRFAQNLH